MTTRTSAGGVPWACLLPQDPSRLHPVDKAWVGHPPSSAALARRSRTRCSRRDFRPGAHGRAILGTVVSAWNYVEMGSSVSARNDSNERLRNAIDA